MESTEHYLETEVLTATPQKLQLMMINGALKFANQAKSLRAHDPATAWEKLIRCREIVAEVLGSLKPDGSEVMKTVAGIYIFLFQELTNVQADDDYERLDGVITVLEEERQTWVELCQAMPEAPERPVEEVQEITTSQAEEIIAQANPTSNSHQIPPSPSYGFDDLSTYSNRGDTGISFDA